MGNFEQEITQKIIDQQLEAVKKRPEYIRGVGDRKLALEQHGVIEIVPKEKPSKILRPVSRRKPSNITPNPVIPEQVELFRNEEGDLVIKRPDEN